MKRHLSLLSIVVILTVSFAGVFSVPQASAARGSCFFANGAGAVGSSGTCSVPGYGAYGTNDVLEGRTNALGRAVPGGMNKYEFATFIIRKFNNGDVHERIGAAFIMQSLRGDNTWPSAGDVQDFQDRVTQPGVTLDYTSAVITRTSWYDAVKKNDFYAPYAAGSRPVLKVYYNGRAHATIEVACGNLADVNIPLPEPPAWGKMTATSAVDNSRAAPGDTVTWTHEVWDTGSVGNDNTPTISGDVYWGPGTDALVPPANRVGPASYPARVQSPTLSYGRSFRKGHGDVATKVYRFVIPWDAQPGTQYCQYINGDNTSSSDASNFRSIGACVWVIVPPSRVTPSIGFASDPIEPGDTTTATAKIQNTSGNPAHISSAHVVVWYDRAPNATYTGGSQQRIIDDWWLRGGDTVVMPGNPGSIQRSYGVTGPPNFRYICASLDITPGANTTPSSLNAHDCTEVVDKPYLSVYGGDAMAGVSPGSDFSCQENNQAGFLSWNQNGGPGGPWHGAGSQMAVMALGSIQSFASSLGSSNLPYALSFANQGGTDTSGNYGGSFGGTNDTDCNFLPAGQAAQPTPPGGLSLGSHTVSGQEAPLYYRGDVFITGRGITYAAGPWASTAAIPSYKLVVMGNIYIQSTVTQLDGIYIAVPDPSRPGSGVISTCAIGATTALPTAQPNYYQACGNQLTINGSFVAKQVRFWRTFATLNQSGGDSNYLTSRAAERFVYSPDLWLSSTPGVAGNAAAYAGLPPVL